MVKPAVPAYDPVLDYSPFNSVPGWQFDASTDDLPPQPEFTLKDLEQTLLSWANEQKEFAEDQRVESDQFHNRYLDVGNQARFDDARKRLRGVPGFRCLTEQTLLHFQNEITPRIIRVIISQLAKQNAMATEQVGKLKLYHAAAMLDEAKAVSARIPEPVRNWLTSQYLQDPAPSSFPLPSGPERMVVIPLSQFNQYLLEKSYDVLTTLDDCRCAGWIDDMRVDITVSEDPKAEAPRHIQRLDLPVGTHRLCGIREAVLYRTPVKLSGPTIADKGPNEINVLNYSSHTDAEFVEACKQALWSLHEAIVNAETISSATPYSPDDMLASVRIIFDRIGRVRHFASKRLDDLAKFFGIVSAGNWLAELLDDMSEANYLSMKQRYSVVVIKRYNAINDLRNIIRSDEASRRLLPLTYAPGEVPLDPGTIASTEGMIAHVAPLARANMAVQRMVLDLAKSLVVKEKTHDIQQHAAPTVSSASRSTKRSTERGEGRVKLIAALTEHHKYAHGGCLNLEPIGVAELARKTANDDGEQAVAKSTASEFFKQEFQGYSKYCVVCRDGGRLADSLKALNNDFAPHDLYGRRPSNEDARDD